MRQNKETTTLEAMFVDPIYIKGQFYEKSTGSIDAAYKINQLYQILLRNVARLPKKLERVADVGCGTGKTTFMLQQMVKDLTGSIPLLDGYDVHPNIWEYPESDSIHFFAEDFCANVNKDYDMVVLFDVIEHVPDPVHFIQEVSRHTRLLAFHIPLDDAILSWIRNLPRENLTHPGHLLVLDLASALNLLTMSGLRIFDFDYSPGFRSPSGRVTFSQKITNPFRAILFRLSPYLAQKLLAGVSLTVLAWTSKGLSEQLNDD
jgi:SAM-dependent methyltransferase